MYRGRQAPKNAVYDAVNVLITDEGLLARRGGSANYSSTDASSNLYRLHALYMRGPAANRIIMRRTGSTAVNVLDASAVPVSMAGDTDWSRPASVGDYAIFAVGYHQILLYGGSQKSATYSTGTLTATNGSVDVTGSGTSWLANVDAGMILNIGGTDFGVVQSVTDNTHLKLASPWANVTATGSAYTLVRTQVLNISAIPFAAATREFAVAAGSGSPRLLFCVGNRVYFTPRGVPLTFTATDYHELPASAQIIGAEGRGDNALLFTTTGVWEIDNLSLDAVDDFGNQQQVVTQINRDVILWDDYGISGFAGKLVIPAVDDVYLFGSGTALAPVTGGRGSQYDGGIRNLYREYVAAGYQPGQAATYQGHYILPILNGTTWVDTLVCRLDHGAAWTRWTGGAGGAGYAVLIEQAARQPKLLGLYGARVSELTACFTPSSANAVDANDTPPIAEITTRDYPTGGQQGGFVARARLRYELTAETDESLAAVWTTDPWHIGNAALEFVDGVIAGSEGANTSRSWLTTSTQSVLLSADTVLGARPAVNINSLVYSALGFVQTPGTVTASGYEVRFRYEVAADTVAIYRYDNTNLTRILDPVALPARLAPGDTLQVNIFGGTIEASVNSDAVGSVSDSAYFSASQPAYLTMGIVDQVSLGTRSSIRHGILVSLAFSSDQDGGVFTELAGRGEQGGGSGWGTSDGSTYMWVDVGKRRERVRFRVRITGAVSTFVLRSFEMLTRPSGRQ